MAWLNGFDPGQTVTWQPIAKVWVLWRWLRGEWSCRFALINPFPFVWADLKPGEAIPLDGRAKAIIIDSSPKTYGGTEEYKAHVVAGRARADASEASRAMDALVAARNAARRHIQISNINPGNRAMLHSLGITPGPPRNIFGG